MRKTKLSSLIGVFLIFASFLQFTSASNSNPSATINFTGSIIEGTYSVSIDEISNSFDTTKKGMIGALTSSVPFSVNIKNAPEGALFFATFSGPTDLFDSNALAIDKGPGAAEGLAIHIMESNNAKVIPLNSKNQHQNHGNLENYKNRYQNHENV